MESFLTPLSSSRETSIVEPTETLTSKLGFADNYGHFINGLTADYSLAPSPSTLVSIDRKQEFCDEDCCSFESSPLWGFHNEIETQAPCYVQTKGFVRDHDDKRVMEAYKSKIARTKRRLARQTSLQKTSFGATDTFQFETRKSLNGEKNNTKNSERTVSSDPLVLYTEDNKRLKMLLIKELKNSDVGSLGRIILPKRETEENLPALTDKEGIQVEIREVFSNRSWSFRFKYWSNNKSRMYVLENTGDFVKQNGLENGDSLALYGDDDKNLYFAIKKARKISKTCELGTNKCVVGQNEEETSLEHLMEQFQEHEQKGCLMSSYRHTGMDPMGPCVEDVNGSVSLDLGIVDKEDVATSSSESKTDEIETPYFEDCYASVDMVFDIEGFGFPF